MNKIPIIMFSIAMLIIGIYYIIPEATYYTNHDTNTTEYIIIPTIGVNESINHESIDVGVYQTGTVVFGHRTSHGSPFYNLDKINVGDLYNISGVTYRVNDVYIVSSSYKLLEETNHSYIITCTPIGSNSQRIIVDGIKV